ncbi:hypothetical protein Bca101_059108 [Brassica carinata]
MSRALSPSLSVTSSLSTSSSLSIWSSLSDTNPSQALSRFIANPFGRVVALLWLCGVVNPFSHCDALHNLRVTLVDPNNVLQSWDPTLVNPCTWFHVTCNNKNSVIRV